MTKTIPLTIQQGATYSSSWALTDANNNPMNFSGYTVAGEVRKEYESINSVSFTASIANSVLTLYMNASTTATLEPTKQVYDIEITDANGMVIRLMEGVVQVTPQVTR